MHRRLLALAAIAFVLPAPLRAVAGEVTITLQSVTDFKSVIATVEPVHVLAARARIGGTLVSVTVKEGDRVETGKLMAKVVDQKIALQLAALDTRIQSADAQLSQAKIDLDRTTALQKAGAAAQALLDQKRTALDVAERTLAGLKADRQVIVEQGSEGDVLAPATGRVLKLNSVEGAVVMPGETVATLAEDQYILRLQLPERHAAILRAGDTVEMAGRDGADARRGTVRIVYPEIQGGRVIADVDVAGLGGYFVGERMRVTVPTGKREVILVPAAAVTLRAGVNYVRLADGTDIVVQPGDVSADGKSIEILSGLKTGDHVVTP